MEWFALEIFSSRTTERNGAAKVVLRNARLKVCVYFTYIHIHRTVIFTVNLVILVAVNVFWFMLRASYRLPHVSDSESLLAVEPAGADNSSSSTNMSLVVTTGSSSGSNLLTPDRSSSIDECYCSSCSPSFMLVFFVLLAESPLEKAWCIWWCWKPRFFYFTALGYSVIHTQNSESRKGIVNCKL